jgi:L-alanine-DL-glutamate epimerase-like enolase superfamily enzyme
VNTARKVSFAQVRRIVCPLDRPFRSGIHNIEAIHNVVVELSDGPHGSSPEETRTGIGYTFAFNQADTAAVFALAVDLAKAVVGQPVGEVRAHWSRAWSRINFIGHAGASVMALAAVDMALWDLHARLAGMPLHSLLGAPAGRWPVYASGGSLALSVDELRGEAERYRAQGYRGYKFRVGQADCGRDEERVAAVREQVGPEFTLMVDANQAWTRASALRACAALEPYRLAWIEEPLSADDFEGMAELRSRVGTPIAAGETGYGWRGMLDLLRAGAVDILQPDLMRCGGVTPFLSVASLAEAFSVTVMPHLFAETVGELLGLFPAGAMIEYFEGWFDHLFGPQLIGAGLLAPAAEVGLGLSLSERAESLTVEAVQLH